MPLDGHVGKKLKSSAPELPKWKSIKSLDADIHKEFQVAALSHAQDKNTARANKQKTRKVFRNVLSYSIDNEFILYIYIYICSYAYSLQ